MRVCKAGNGDIAARIPGVFSVRVSNVVRGPSGYFTWTRSVTVMVDVGVRIDLQQRRRVRVNRPVESSHIDSVTMTSLLSTIYVQCCPRHAVGIYCAM